MIRYQQWDPGAAAALVAKLSPQLHRFFAGQIGSVVEAEDMLQDLWLRIHRVRRTYRPGEPFLPWVYAIARRARVDNDRKRESAVELKTKTLPAFEDLVASISENQRAVLTMLNGRGLSLEEVASATFSSGGGGKQKVHRAYRRLRDLPRQGEFAQPMPKGVAK